MADPGEPQPPATNPTPADAPDAPKKGTTSYILWTILLWIDLGLIAWMILEAVLAGIVLITAPDSDMAEVLRRSFESASARQIVVGTLLTFVALGVIPLAWVLGTRRQALLGTERFLRLHDPGRGVLRGVLLTIPILLGLLLLLAAYTVLTEGADSLFNPEEDANAPVQALVRNLTWPLAILVALSAGIGEEIFFRGFLQRYFGVWGQAAVFGLAHASGGYIPQVVIAFGIGILFGYLIKRGWSLWTMITAHTLYNFTLLSLALLSPEVA